VAHSPVHEFATVAASILVLAAGLSAVAVDRLSRRGVLGPPDHDLPLDKLLVIPLVVLSLGAAAIHFGVISEHFAEWWAAGAFFIVVGWFQAFWAVLLAVRAGRTVGAVGALGNAAIVGVWLVSRTVGLPFGPEAGVPESVGLADAAATLLEVGLVVGGAVLAGIGGAAVRRLRMSVAAAAMWGAVFTVGVVVLTFAALANLAPTADHSADHSHRSPATGPAESPGEAAVSP
jgi:hypothetical protein